MKFCLLGMIVGGSCLGIALGRSLEGEPDPAKLIPEEESDADDEKSTLSWWIIVVIPIISALVGYGTNVVALKMTFFPTEFWGWRLWQPEGQPFGLFGWQGIIPAKARIMAGTMMDLFLEKLIDVNEIFGRVDPQMMAFCLTDGARSIFQDIVATVAKNTAPSVWDALPEYVQRETISCVEKEAEEFIKLLMLAIKSNILQVLDLKGLAERRAEEHKGIMANMFLEIGRKECRIIELSGLGFGFLFGCLQAVLYFYYQGVWILPVAGLFVGLFTNYIALKAVFEPAEAWKIGDITIFQGFFVRRQQEAAGEIATLGHRHFLSPDLLIDEMLHGKKQKAFRELLDNVCATYIQQTYSPVERIMAPLILGPDGSQSIRMAVVEIIHNQIAVVFPAAYSVMDNHMDIKNTLAGKISRMSPTDFVSLLRPAFEEEEVKLIIVGGILGLLVGFIQQFTLIPFLR